MKKFLLPFVMISASLCAVAQKTDTLPDQKIDAVVVQSFRISILKSDIPNVVEIVTPAQITRSTATSLNEIIKLSTAAESSEMQGLTGGIELRGFTPAATGNNLYTLLLTDGIRMGTRNSTTTFLSNVNSIEILKGPYSALYGSGAMGGVINIVTPQHKGAVSGGATLSYGSYRTTSVGVYAGGSITRKLDFDLVFDYLKRADDYHTGSNNLLKTTDYEKAVLDTHSYDTIYRNTSYDKTRGVVRLGYDISKSWRLNLVNDIYYTDDAAANGMLWGMYDQTDKRVFRNTHRIDLTGVAGVHSLRFTPFVGFESSDSDNRGQWGNTKSEYGYDTYGFTVQDAIRIGSLGNLTVGVDNLTEHYTSTQAQADGTPQAPYQPDYNNTQTGAFAQFNFTLLSGKLTGIAGLRYDDILYKTFETENLDTESDKHNYNTVNPNFSLQFKPLQGIRVHAGIGRAFLAPDAYKTAGGYTSFGIVYKGNPDLKPETALTTEAGIGYRSTQGVLELDLSIYSTKHDNLTFTDFSNVGYVTYGNADKASIGGFEALASYDLGYALGWRNSWKLHAYYTRIFHSEIETATSSSEHMYLSRTKASLGTDISIKRLTLSLSTRYASSKKEYNWIFNTEYPSYARIPYVTPQGLVVRPSLCTETTIRIPDYMLADMSASYQIANKVTVGAKIANLFDELYSEHDGYYMPGRNFSININIKF